MKNDNKEYSVTYTTNQLPSEIFTKILNVRGWWSGLYAEEISGITDELNAEFTFHAGGGIHYSKQKLIELVPGKKITWLVTDSKLTFAETENEWTGTKIAFEITAENNQTKVAFTHHGLVP